MPSQLVNFFLVANILRLQPNALDHCVDFGRLEEDHKQLHDVGEEKASLQLHLLVYVHQHEFELSFRLAR